MRDPLDLLVDAIEKLAARSPVVFAIGLLLLAGAISLASDRATPFFPGTTSSLSHFFNFLLGCLFATALWQHGNIEATVRTVTQRIRRRGRPKGSATGYDAETKQRLVQDIRRYRQQGVSWPGIAARIGVSEDTCHRWYAESD